MPDVRVWAAFGTGLATGVAGAFALTRRRKPGIIIQIGGDFYVQASVIDAVAARAAKVVRKKQDVEMLLIRVHGRGVLSFKEAAFWADMPRYGKLYQATMLDTDQGLPEFGIRHGEPRSEIRDVLIELAAYGLARPGPWFPSRHEFTTNRAKGAVSFEIEREPPRVVEVEVESRRPSGSYFKIGDSYYADERFLERIEWTTGADIDASSGDVEVPLWRRGKLKFLPMAQARALPEQQGKLYLLRSELVGVELEDLLTELVGLGLVGWGGEWTAFPTQPGDHKPTGTPPWAPAGEVVSYEGEEYVDEATVKQMLTRLPSEQSPYVDGKLRFTWRTHSILLQPVESRSVVRMRGQVYSVGRADDPDVQAIVDEMILRRITRRPDASTSSATTAGSLGHFYVKENGMTVIDAPFAIALRSRAKGYSHERDLSIRMRFGAEGDIVLQPLDMAQGGLADVLRGQVGEAYVVELKYTRNPLFWDRLRDSLVQSGKGQREDFKVEDEPTAGPGSLYRRESHDIIDGRLAGRLAARAKSVSRVDFGVALDMGEGSIVLRLLSYRLGPPPTSLPDQVGAAFEVDLSGLTRPALWEEIMGSLVKEGKARRINVEARGGKLVEVAA